MASVLPKLYRRLQVHTLSTDFRKSTQIVSAALPSLLPNHVLVAPQYVGINASDINATAGRYNPGTPPPFDCGMEAVGRVLAIGSAVKSVKVGDAVGTMSVGAFGECLTAPEHTLVPLPTVSPKYVPIMVSGLTASLALEEVGQLRAGETVLVTAAAGGTGQFAVQLAKLAGCHVIGTCSSDEKTEFLKKLGCDRVVNYKTEDLDSVLAKEYPKGVDVCYESVGGSMFETCLNRIAVKGRIIVIGFISGYTAKSFTGSQQIPAITPKLLMKSASVRGFFLFHYAKQWRDHMIKLARLVDEGKLQAEVDAHALATFKTLEAIPDAVEYLHTGRSVGKVVAGLPKDFAEPFLAASSKL
eukprot:Colp12_sorted_trinity150504_noHs@1826